MISCGSISDADDMDPHLLRTFVAVARHGSFSAAARDLGYTQAAIGVGEEQPVVILPRSHPLAGRTGLRLADLIDARWIDAPGTAAPLGDLRRAGGAEGFRAALRYEGTDTGTLVALAAAGHGLTVLPGPAAGQFPGVAGVPITLPRLVHRTELLHGSIGAGSPAAALATLLAG